MSEIETTAGVVVAVVTVTEGTTWASEVNLYDSDGDAPISLDRIESAVCEVYDEHGDVLIRPRVVTQYQETYTQVRTYRAPWWKWWRDDEYETRRTDEFLSIDVTAAAADTRGLAGPGVEPRVCPWRLTLSDGVSEFDLWSADESRITINQGAA